jgi:hypothetical protein
MIIAGIVFLGFMFDDDDDHYILHIIAIACHCYYILDHNS